MDRIDALRLFSRIAERGSFSAAAVDMKIKQSTASKWVAALEEELGATLVERTTRSLRITDAGRHLLERARAVLAAFDEMTGEVTARDAEPSGHVRISLPVVFGRLFAAPSIASFLLAYPDVRAEIVFADRYVDLVAEGFDVALRVGVPVDTSSRGTKIAESRRVLVASPRYLASHGKPGSPRELRDHECLAHGDAASPAVWRFRRGGGAFTPATVRGRVAANNSEAVLLLAHKGLGIALLADWLVDADIRRGKLVPLLRDYEPPPAPIFALRPPGKFYSATSTALVQHLVSDVGARLSRGAASAPRVVTRRASRSP
jgi:DNA-binding transcriptional LysR family regulator